MKNKCYIKEAIGVTILTFTFNGVAYSININDGDKPNIVIVLADDLGWGDVGYHGSHIKTPNIDNLASTGINLNRFYVSPISTPTRAGLLTGRYPNRMGVRDVVIPPWRDYGIEENEIFLPQELEKAGYKHRVILGKWHLGHSKKKNYPLNKGFTHFYGHLNGAIDYFSHYREGELDWHNDWESSYDKGYSTDLITDRAVKLIKEYGDNPFFIYVAYNAPHSPFQAKDEDLMLYGFDKSKPRYGKGDKTGHGNTPQQTYAAMVTCMDRGIGRIIQTLKDEGKFENTIFIFMSDNGADIGSSGELRGRKFQEFEGGVRVPSILSWPAKLHGKRTINQTMGVVDIMPTILDILDQKSDAEFDGISMLPVLTGKKKSIKRNLYLGAGAVVTNKWKYIEIGHNPQMKITENQLFRIDKDPVEAENLIRKNKRTALKLKKFVNKYDTITPPRPLPKYGEGREGFVPPKEWKIVDE